MWCSVIFSRTTFQQQEPDSSRFLKSPALKSIKKYTSLYTRILTYFIFSNIVRLRLFHRSWSSIILHLTIPIHALTSVVQFTTEVFFTELRYLKWLTCYTSSPSIIMLYLPQRQEFSSRVWGSSLCQSYFIADVNFSMPSADVSRSSVSSAYRRLY